MNKDLLKHIKNILKLKEQFVHMTGIENENDSMNIWARWIITHRSLFKQSGPFLLSDNEYNAQFIIELIEKGVPSDTAYRIYEWIKHETLNCTFHHLADTEFGGIHGDLNVTTEKYINTVTMECNDISVDIPLTVYNKLLAAIKVTYPFKYCNHSSYIWYTSMLYNLLDGKGLQWSTPNSVMMILRSQLKCKTELFASPLNHCLDNYYSLFPIDKLFNSRGNFFTAPEKDFKSGTFQVNPPFIDSLFTKTTIKILKLLKIADDNNAELTFIYIMPKWESFNTYNMLLESPYCIKNISLKANRHYYYEHITNTYIKARFGTCILLLSTNSKCCDMSTESDIITAFCKHRF
jgi:hypothetical protein